MEKEIELKILDIDSEVIEQKLLEIGAVKVGNFSMRRYVYDLNGIKSNSWIRLRDNGTTTTIALKEIVSNTLEGTNELEITIDDFEKGDLLLRKLGYQPRSYQENNRISYTISNTKIEIDSWPKIPSYIEIESTSTEEIKDIVTKLGYTMDQTVTVNTDEVYKMYNLNLDDFKSLKFE